MDKIVKLITMGDGRGSLIALEENHNVPFDVKRVFYIFGTQEGIRRGYHAHHFLKQFAICVAGSCKFLLDDGKERHEYLLDSPDKGLLIEGMYWREMFEFSPDCILLVLADDYYSPESYIRDYQEFLRVVKENDSQTIGC